MPDHIEQRRNLWYATLKVPADLHDKLGKTKFLQSLHTADRRVAVPRAAALVAQWQATIREARGEPEAVEKEAMWWRQALAEARDADSRRPPADDGVDFDEQTDVTLDIIESKAEDIERTRGSDAAARFAAIATGRRTPSALHLEDWQAAQSHLAAKTQDQMFKDVQTLVDRFATLEEMTPTALRRYGDDLAKGGTSPASLARRLSFWRSYWKFLQRAEVVRIDTDPFRAVTIKDTGKTKKRGGWAAFKPDQVPPLWIAAEAKGDQPLADLVRLGAYTGARIEELCSLRVEDIDTEGRIPCLRIVDAKTRAGIREVPLHASIRPLVKRLAKASTDGYVMSGLTRNKYDDRSNAIGKRFGRLKAEMGHGGDLVFHSLRKTVVTMLANAGVPERDAADIVGHEKKTMTYGLYDAGASLQVKAAAVAKLRYPVA